MVGPGYRRCSSCPFEIQRGSKGIPKVERESERVDIHPYVLTDFKHFISVVLAFVDNSAQHSMTDRQEISVGG